MQDPLELLRGRLNQCTLELNRTKDTTTRIMLIARRMAFNEAIEILQGKL
jgi:hypothetical protein